MTINIVCGYACCLCAYILWKDMSAERCKRKRFWFWYNAIVAVLNFSSAIIVQLITMSKL